MEVPSEPEIMQMIELLQRWGYKDTEEALLIDLTSHGHDTVVPSLFNEPVSPVQTKPPSQSIAMPQPPPKPRETQPAGTSRGPSTPKELFDFKHSGKDEWEDDDDLGYIPVSVERDSLLAHLMEEKQTTDKAPSATKSAINRPDKAEEDPIDQINPTATPRDKPAAKPAPKPATKKPKIDVRAAIASANGKQSEDDDSEKPDDGYEVFYLKVFHRRMHTGFEETKDFPIRHNDIVAGRYQVVGYIGSAAFSKAIQCVDLVSGSLVCLKVIKNNKDYFDQSLDEVKLIKYINAHDPADSHHVLQMYDFFYFKEHLFIVCELLRENLYEFSKYNRESESEPYFTLPRLQRITKQVLTALSFIHSLNLIHCDLKPENILIQSYSRCLVRVIDFGSSCFTSDHLSSYVQSRSYRAPEVILGLPYDGRIDVWSLGCVLAELFTGNVLFQSDSAQGLLCRISAVMGPYTKRMLTEGRHSSAFFTKGGVVYRKSESADTYEVLSARSTLIEARLKCHDPDFVSFVKALLSIDPLARPTASEALKLPFITKEYPQI